MLGVSLTVSKSSEHCWGDFFTRWWGPEEEWFWRYENFSKLKTAFCEYWTSNKIKISMTCISKEHEIKTKMVQEQWLQLKMTVFLLVWIHFWEGGWENFWLVGGLSPSPHTENPVYMHKYIYNIIYMYNTYYAGFYIQWRSSVYMTIHHVPKWPSYFCKIWVNDTRVYKAWNLYITYIPYMCVTDIYGIYMKLWNKYIYIHLSVQCS